MVQTAAVNEPRWDYAGGVLRGLLIEEARGNNILNSGDAGNASWGVSSITSGNPVVTSNQVVAPDGTLTGARVVFPAVSGAGNASLLNMRGAGVTPVADVYSESVWARGNVGGERLYMMITPNGTLFYRVQMVLTTAWQRFSFTTAALTAVGHFPAIGTDLRDVGQTATLAQTVYIWGGQLEQGAFPTSYIPTTSVTVVRAQDFVTLPAGAWFDQTKGSLSHEYLMLGVVNGFASSVALVGAAPATDYIIPEQYDNTGTPTTPSVGAAAVSVGATLAYCLLPSTSAAAGPVHKSASSWVVGSQVNAMHDGIGKSSDNGSVTALPVITSLIIGGTMHSQPLVSQWARRTQYWPRVLSNAELQAVTT
jgi:hypothetical protein